MSLRRRLTNLEAVFGGGAAVSCLSCQRWVEAVDLVEGSPRCIHCGAELAALPAGAIKAFADVDDGEDKDHEPPAGPAGAEDGD